MLEEYLKLEFWNNTAKDYLIATGIIVIGILIVRIFKKTLLQKIKSLTEKTSTNFDDYLVAAIEKFVIPALYISIVFFGIRTLSISDGFRYILSNAHKVILAYYIVRLVSSVLILLLKTWVREQENGEEKVKQIGGIILIINVLIWGLGILFLFDNLGYDVTAIVTGMGIGGIAVALAAQNILGDLFNYFVIFFDRPIEIGDFIVIDDKNGVVEKIGIKTTRVKTLSGEQLVIANSDLTSSRIHNYKKMQRRRILFGVGVTYETSNEDLKRIPGILKEIVNHQQPITFDRAHFKEFGDSSLNFEVVYYIEDAAYNTYMDIQQQINFEIFDRFQEMGISIAFPTRTLYVRNENGQKLKIENTSDTEKNQESES
ncbi:mechanosensitive ion channel family protein [Cyclobacterium marinum]|uniref:MscS Mechanosensitive ion channel n=1 Tax=Cyclobacterium marinum (strain ATCC 25205 / DSM 745 / LMG 13164 / NCIMB 1802) TaxID=880070 RepID=G0J228_CYCMS|nr:mechanosensitive ion channel family protein [Cyclobacterium marinum]AEL24537.1 MscS Mechanosensitive ion channel [Cyclobacterium marinum DSM 745]|tara:strand:+ start:36866 stop:37981 length:1116 start_codon:yes stop_codon:yes gene_type:complete